jgi:cyclic beta-1,2-glucan synthetase
MIKLIPAAHELISNMRALFQTNNSSFSYLNEEPLRAELFSSEQMRSFGKALALKHKLSDKPAKDHLLKRLADNEIVLHEVRKLITDAIKKKYLITPAAEWLIDNFYLAEEHIRNAKAHFPKDYSEALPQLSASSAGLTRIYHIALQLISHSDGRIDMEILKGFIKSYQSVTNLKIGELWAIPIMLRLALIENLRRVASRIAIDRVDRNLANYWADQMIQATEEAPKDLILIIADMARSQPPMVSAFVSELTRKLQGKGQQLALPLNWIEQLLLENGVTSNDLINEEVQKQAADQVSMSNSIGSLRLLGSMNWRDFVETHSIVEHILQEDKMGVYSSMDFATRDRYRHAVEYLAKKSNLSEPEIAHIAIRLAHESSIGSEKNDYTSHVGYYLIGAGISLTKKQARTKEPRIKVIRSFLHRQALPIYLFLIFAITTLITGAILIRSYQDTQSILLLLCIAALTFLCASQLASSVVNFFSTLLVRPDALPRMDFSDHIPADCRTLVITPVMLNTIADTEILVEALEVRFLANRNTHLHFGLLTDFADAEHETLPQDDALIDSVRKKIQQLNKKYSEENRFFLFHRPRHWNSKENAWMGYERKRGKISELNSLLRGSGHERFSLIEADQSIFPQVKYVITLDADTQLPMGSAWKLIGTMAHPLNRPWYNEKKKRVTRGYGILQPRVTVSLPDSTASVYARMHGNEPGIDPYTRASSDVYQDLFGEGSFIGKGIYDVDIFKTVLSGRFSENGILSHDLLEGSYVRSGLLSDVQLFEKYPTTYHADIKRRSRWIRGDWQIFAWFLPIVPGPENTWSKNPISLLSRWKIADNIRRSLVPIALTTLMISGWIVLPSSLFWTGIVSALIIIPILIGYIWNIVRIPKDVTLVHHIKNSIKGSIDTLKTTLFTLICLPHEAFSNITAISRTLWRMMISRKKLLEWNPSAKDETTGKTSMSSSYYFMWTEPILAWVVFIILLTWLPEKLLIASPIILLWIIAPFVTWKISKPIAKQVAKLTNEQAVFLQKISRKTWSFFEHFVGNDDNWLPPDNFQEQPVKQIAHRTSPTNIGLLLLANLSARDFGYINNSEFIERTRKTIITLQKMEKYKGHFYNWYDTQSLEPLIPKYISTVDSGNLAGHLMVLKQGLLTINHQHAFRIKLFEGIRDTVWVLDDTLNEKDKTGLHRFKNALETAFNSDLVSIAELHVQINELSRAVDMHAESSDQQERSEASVWMQRLKEQVGSLNNELSIFAPWILLLSSPLTFKDIVSVDSNITLKDLLKETLKLQVQAELKQQQNHTDSERLWLGSFIKSLNESVSQIRFIIDQSETLATECNELAEMEWEFLYDKSSHLFSIGYNAQEHHTDQSFYDLLASEARLCTFIAISQGKLPEESWFALGRLLTNVDGDPILLSWSGSMFEYLMPLLIMPTYENTLLDQTCKAAVKWQIKYGKKAGVPWGISESGYNMVNANSNYQYRAFGAPGLGLKRDLGEDTVIAPYASALALMVAPEEACKNLEMMHSKGFSGKYGFYEAVDYTPFRLPPGQSHAVVCSFMAHHQGMSLLSLAYLLLDQPMQKLFEAEPQFKATLLLLQERIPKASAFLTHTTDIADINYASGGTETRIIHTPRTAVPEVQLLSNGKYHVMITNTGGGYSRWKDLAVTRWREDGTRDHWGTFCYISDPENETWWSNTHQPMLKKADKYEVAFSQGRVDFRTANHEIETHTEIVVSPEDDIEMRRVHITNQSTTRRTIEITSYAEVVIAPYASDLMQPTFSNLFVETEIIPEQHAILCTRRPRSAEEQAPWFFHLMTMQGKQPEEISYETDRMAFIGRGNTTANPKAMHKPGPLSGSEGSVLDPVVSIRYKITLEAEETLTVDMIMGIAETRQVCKDQIGKYQDKHHKDRALELAWTHSQVILRQINASEADAQLYGSLAGSILYMNAALRADASVLINNQRGQSGLWGYSISGDLPIVLLKIEDQSNIQLVKELVQAHAYWRLKGLAVDLVIWNEEHSNYRQVFQNDILALIPPELRDKPGGIFVRGSDQISNEDRVLFQTVARINISDHGGTLADHIKRKPLPKTTVPYIIPTQTYLPSSIQVRMPDNLLFFNGSGGFSADGKEYVISTKEDHKTPAPWVNVIANPNFGTVISESGSAYTWIENAHELRLTPWNNDPVSDPTGEAFYLRDEESGHFWSTTPLPTGSTSSYLTRHGFGYSIFEHMEDGIHSEMTIYVDPEASIKFTVLKIRNQSGRSRKLSATGYTEWVLGDDRTKSAMHIHTEIDPDSGAFFAKNPFNTEFHHRVAFFDVDPVKKSFTGDRTEFIGRNGTLKRPEAMLRVKLSGKVGLALDPCAAIQVPFDLDDGEEHEIIFRLGCAASYGDASNMAKRFRGSAMASESLNKVKEYWAHTLGALQVETPDKAIDLIANGWLTYQTLSSRIWGRSGFYQSGGAFGFRDQLQDVISLLHTRPEIAREQILLCASRQFKEGDVQHWWHPPTGRGVRTRCSDDLLWLPYVTSVYLSNTRDQEMLNVQVPFLEGRILNTGEESYYDLPAQSGVSATVYEHCRQAIKHSLHFGEHGLPFIGSGDWNDGLDKVGIHGKGESVWLGFFLYEILVKFAKVANNQGDQEFAAQCNKEADQLKANLDQHAWDGEWYKRAWFDDGTALGTSTNDECRIDSIAQSWSVLSGAGDKNRIITAMESAYDKLVRKDAGIIQLLDPPFDKSAMNPGYIKGYVPGIRENGGQYTHAAIWLIMAFAKLGDHKRVWELLDMINPVNHGKTAADVAAYKVEPYVLAADVYARAPHAGRGGWTWYTGSASWMYRLITESFLGLQREGNQLSIIPCIPQEWESYKVHYRYHSSTYHITVTQKKGIGETMMTVDGAVQENRIIVLEADGVEHDVQVTLFTGGV